MCLSRTGKRWISVLVCKWLVFQNTVTNNNHFNFYYVDIIPHIAEDILRPSLLSAVSSPSSYFTVAVNNTLTDIVSVLNGSSVNLTVTYAQYATAVAFHYFNVTPTQSSRISNGSSNCIHQAILNHVYKTDYAVELVELFGNISAAIKILKQVCTYVGM